MTRAAIVAEAERWVGTPYHHAGSVRGAGVDCAMLPVCIFTALGLVPPFDPRPYSPDWMLHRSEEKFLGWVARFGDRVEVPQPGDLALFRFGRCVSHGGIVVSPSIMVHADLKAGCVERAEIARFADRLHSYWSVHGV